MASKEPLFDITGIDLNHVVADIDVIRKYNPQRFEMEQLTAIVHQDPDNNRCIGYKDLTQDDFWVRGHMPGMPLMPGVIMLEAIAQMCSYFVQRYDLLGAAMVGFGGLEEVRFREPVLPGDRLYLLCELVRVRRGAIIVSKFQGMVRDSIVVEGVLKGVPIPVEAVQAMRDRNK